MARATRRAVVPAHGLVVAEHPDGCSILNRWLDRSHAIALGTATWPLRESSRRPRTLPTGVPGNTHYAPP